MVEVAFLLEKVVMKVEMVWMMVVMMLVTTMASKVEEGI